jgi:thiamine biosynthesis lipoprotein
MTRAEPLSRRELLSGGRRPSDDEGYWVRVHRRAMACRFEVTLAHEDARHVEAARAALDEAERVEAVLTVFRDSSEVSAVNRAAAHEAIAVGPMLYALLERCRLLHEATGGAFDPTSGPLTRSWGFLARQGRRPAPAEIEAARAAVGLEHVQLDAGARTVRFAREGMSLNFGAIGKGVALDRMAALLRARGVPRALVSAGGSSAVAIGGGLGFPIDLRSPRRTAALGRLWLGEAALGTSGAGEQYFEADGRRFGHVIDPRSGWPAEGVLSASVAAPEAALADALSTAFLVAGPELAERYCAANPGTLAVLTLEGEPPRRLEFGVCGGARLAAASAE